MRMQIQSHHIVEKPTIVCSVEHQSIVEGQLRELGVEPYKIILEPVGRNTAPVAAIVSQELDTNKDELILLLPADHHVIEKEGFWRAVELGKGPANDGHLITFGIEPSHPETGYGYIQSGSTLSKNCVKVAKFVEKPDKNTAKSYLESKDYFWNAGIFLFAPKVMLAAFEAHATGILNSTKNILSVSERKDNKVFLDPGLFKKCRNESIDYAIMESADNVAMVCPVSIGWNDIGSWEAVKTFNQIHKDHLVEVGDVLSIDCKNSYFRSDGPLITAVGLDDIVIVATNDAILVVKAGKTQSVKKVVQTLEKQGRRDLL